MNEQSKRKNPFYFYMILILIPFIFLLTLESSLRLFNYGNNYKVWIKVTKTKQILNPEIARRYFHNIKNPPASIQDVFDIKKKKGSFRIFVMGGSSAAGYPFMPLGSFSRYLQQRLQLVYPQTKIEVINVAITAVNTYTIRDLLDSVIEQKPDAILLYAGHNEFYGALGVGSMESLGRSRKIVNLLLYLKKFRTFQLLSNVISKIKRAFEPAAKVSHGTLMSLMAKNKYIGLNSEIFKQGVEQFKGNLRDIILTCKRNGVPLLIGTLVSNYKGIKPFVSKKFNNYPSAESIYEKAQKEEKENAFIAADSMYRFAKDLDMLRFRAPEIFNKIILKLSKKYKIPTVNIDSVFSANSPNGIVGNNLMTDHLHPTLNGYFLIGNAFADKLARLKITPRGIKVNYPLALRDKLTRQNFKFSELDSVIAAYRIKILKNDFPYKNPGDKPPLKTLLQPKNFIDSLAFVFLQDKISWEKAHRILADKYLKEKNYKAFLKQMDILISQYPIITGYYLKVVNLLLNLKQFDRSYKYFKSYYEIQPNAFNTKWMGIIALSHKNLKEAIEKLNESLKFKKDDAQVYYNLAGAYALKKDFKKAKKLVATALNLNPDYRQAKKLYEEIKYK